MEKEGAGTPTQGLLHLIRQKSIRIADIQNFFNLVKEAFLEYLDECGGYDSKFTNILDFKTVTFSLALPRLLSSLVYHLMRYYHLPIQLDNRFYMGWIGDALNTIVGMHEIRGKLWIRNGNTVRSLVQIYRSPKFCSHTFDLDFHSLQASFAQMSASGEAQLMLVLLGTRCRIMEVLSLRDIESDSLLVKPSNRMFPEKSTHMIESFLTILIELIGFTKFSGRTISNISILEKEIVVILATKSRGHAEVLQNIPGGDPNESADGMCASPHTVSEIDRVLEQVADFHPGTGFQTGVYTLNKHGWSKFDPVYLLHRSIQVSFRKKYFIKPENVSETFEKVERFRNSHRKLLRVLQIQTRWNEVYANPQIGHVLSRPL